MLIFKITGGAGGWVLVFRVRWGGVLGAGFQGQVGLGAGCWFSGSGGAGCWVLVFRVRWGGVLVSGSGGAGCWVLVSGSGGAGCWFQGQVGWGAGCWFSGSGGAGCWVLVSGSGGAGCWFQGQVGRGFKLQLLVFMIAGGMAFRPEANMPKESGGAGYQTKSGTTRPGVEFKVFHLLGLLQPHDCACADASCACMFVLCPVPALLFTSPPTGPQAKPECLY